MHLRLPKVAPGLVILVALLAVAEAQGGTTESVASPRLASSLNAIIFAAIGLQSSCELCACVSTGPTPATDGRARGQSLPSRDRKSTRLNSSHSGESRMPSSA